MKPCNGSILADMHNSVISYIRKGKDEKLLCVHNFTPSYHPEYVLHFGPIQQAEEVFNSDDERFGGSGKRNARPEIIRDGGGGGIGLRIAVAPLATMIFRIT